jgi:hydroxyacid-oxoacid transhydrogenase
MFSQMACSNIRFGVGVTKEIGMDLKNIGSKKACVFADPYLVDKAPVKAVLESLSKHGCNFELFSDIRVEPTDTR